MQELLDWQEYIEDNRQKRKVRHTLKDILVIVLFATLVNTDDGVEMALFVESYQEYFRKYIELKNGIPSYDTIRRVMGNSTGNPAAVLWKMAGTFKQVSRAVRGHQSIESTDYFRGNGYGTTIVGKIWICKNERGNGVDIESRKVTAVEPDEDSIKIRGTITNLAGKIEKIEKRV